MNLPYLRPVRTKTKKYIVSFRGINYGEGYGEGEFSETVNTSSALYPCLSQRFGRVESDLRQIGSFALYAKDGLLQMRKEGVTDPIIIMQYNDNWEWVQGESGTTMTEGKKQMASVGDYIIIFPDKIWFNVETGEVGKMEEICEAEGLAFTHNTITAEEDWKFRVGDAVAITGCTVHPENNKTIIVRKVEGKTLTFYDNSFTEGTETGSVRVAREVPDLDYICESNYRLWGVKGNTIYGSKYGDPFNFNNFDGLSGDSYYIDVATDGEFTGCIPFGSHICFFKENVLHKLYGNRPANFQLVTSQVYGVQKGSSKSMCVINETLFYKGTGGVYAYTGGVPELVSECFGQRRYSEAVAASDGSRYYISMKDSGGEWHFFSYDTMHNMWMHEDNLHCVDMVRHEGKVWMLTADSWLGYIDEAADISDVEWSATLCPFNETMNERKGYSRFHMRLELGDKAHLRVEIKRNTDKKWEEVYLTHNDWAKTVTVPILPERCDSVEIRLSGKGACKLKTFIREFFIGGDR